MYVLVVKLFSKHIFRCKEALLMHLNVFQVARKCQSEGLLFILDANGFHCFDDWFSSIHWHFLTWYVTPTFYCVFLQWKVVSWRKSMTDLVWLIKCWPSWSVFHTDLQWNSMGFDLHVSNLNRPKLHIHVRKIFGIMW